jgi:hypothetical protein
VNETTEPLRCQFDQRFCIGLVLDIAGERDRLTSGTLDFSDKRVDFVLASGRYDELCALLRKQQCGGAGCDGRPYRRASPAELQSLLFN